MTEYDPIKLLQQRDAALEDRLNALAERISSVAKQVADLIVVFSEIKACRTMTQNGLNALCGRVDALVLQQPTRTFADAMLQPISGPSIERSELREETSLWSEQPVAIHG